MHASFYRCIIDSGFDGRMIRKVGALRFLCTSTFVHIYMHVYANNLLSCNLEHWRTTTQRVRKMNVTIESRLGERETACLCKSVNDCKQDNQEEESLLVYSSID